MAKGQKRPETAIPNKLSYTQKYHDYKNKTNKHKTKTCQKLAKLTMIDNKTWFKFISKVLSSFAVFKFCIQRIP